MSDNQSWYQRKMAQMRGPQAPLQARPQQQQQQPYPPQQYAPYQQPQLQHYGQLPHQQPPPPPQQPDVTIDNLFDAMKFWKGGPAHQVDKDPCPNCGSPQFYSRQVGRRGPPPAPHCYNCGYNDGMFTQGEATTWGMTG